MNRFTITTALALVLSASTAHAGFMKKADEAPAPTAQPAPEAPTPAPQPQAAPEAKPSAPATAPQAKDDEDEAPSPSKPAKKPVAKKVVPPRSWTGTPILSRDTGTLRMQTGPTTFTELHLAGVDPLPNPTFAAEIGAWARHQNGVTCVEVAKNTGTVRCHSVGGVDLGYITILNGYALPTSSAPAEYQRAGQVAKQSQRGMYAVAAK